MRMRSLRCRTGNENRLEDEMKRYDLKWIGRRLGICVWDYFLNAKCHDIARSCRRSVKVLKWCDKLPTGRMALSWNVYAWSCYLHRVRLWTQNSVHNICVSLPLWWSQARSLRKWQLEFVKDGKKVMSQWRWSIMCSQCASTFFSRPISFLFSYGVTGLEMIIPAGGHIMWYCPTPSFLISKPYLECNSKTFLLYLM